MVKLAEAMGWQSFEDNLSTSFCADNGRHFCPVRLMVVLHDLKYASSMNDEVVLEQLLENFYWQYFTGRICLNMNIRVILRQCHADAKNLLGTIQKKCLKKV